MICAAVDGHALRAVVRAFSDLPAGTVLAHRAPAYGGVLVLALIALADAARAIHGRHAVDDALQFVATRLAGGLLFAKAAAWGRCAAPRDALGLALVAVEPDPRLPLH